MSGGGGGGGGGRDDGYVVPRPNPDPHKPVPSTTGSGGGGGGDGSGADPCNIVQTAALNSPQPAVVLGLNVGDVLDVALGGTPGRPVLEVRDQAGRVAGSLTHRGHIHIIECLNQGNTYAAVVVGKTGGMVTVRVQRR